MPDGTPIASPARAVSLRKDHPGPDEFSLGQATHLFRGRERAGGIRELFHRSAHRVSVVVGSPYAFIQNSPNRDAKARSISSSMS
jgi:hypothetical protein